MKKMSAFIKKNWKEIIVFIWMVLILLEFKGINSNLDSIHDKIFDLSISATSNTRY